MQLGGVCFQKMCTKLPSFFVEKEKSRSQVKKKKINPQKTTEQRTQIRILQVIQILPKFQTFIVVSVQNKAFGFRKKKIKKNFPFESKNLFPIIHFPSLLLFLFFHHNPFLFHQSKKKKKKSFFFFIQTFFSFSFFLFLYDLHLFIHLIQNIIPK